MKKNFSPIFLFDGVPLPSNPSVGYLEESEQLTKGTRNTNGRTIAQPINRRINKFSGISFPELTVEDVSWLKNKVANFEVALTYYDSEELDVIVRKFYFGNCTAKPREWDNTFKPVARPTKYADVKVNIIDMGY